MTRRTSAASSPATGTLARRTGRCVIPRRMVRCGTLTSVARRRQGRRLCRPRRTGHVVASGRGIRGVAVLSTRRSIAFRLLRLRGRPAPARFPSYGRGRAFPGLLDFGEARASRPGPLPRNGGIIVVAHGVRGVAVLPSCRSITSRLVLPRRRLVPVRFLPYVGGLPQESLAIVSGENRASGTGPFLDSGQIESRLYPRGREAAGKESSHGILSRRRPLFRGAFLPFTATSIRNAHERRFRVRDVRTAGRYRCVPRRRPAVVHFRRLASAATSGGAALRPAPARRRRRRLSRRPPRFAADRLL
mmetsp:Transcript_10257/g.20618  ORF Transcript_10257/g.20618 Transcript_10257/m.20618 type:complete len:303 (-) Transcript_10257:674-1582(-)